MTALALLHLGGFAATLWAWRRSIDSPGAAIALGCVAYIAWPGLLMAHWHLAHERRL